MSRDPKKICSDQSGVARSRSRDDYTNLGIQDVVLIIVPSPSFTTSIVRHPMEVYTVILN